MIFVTVGTHEQPFNRLIEYVDNLKKNRYIQEDVIMQIGYSTYKPKHCKWTKFLAYNEMQENVKKARIVITHGGPASFIMPLQIEKIPIVVPRQKQFNEHINNHQVEFAKNVAERMGMIIPIFNIDELKDVISKYDDMLKNMNCKIKSNNLEFNNKLETIVNNMMRINN